MMKTANLEKITVLTENKQVIEWSQAPVTALGDMMSIFRRRNPLMKSKTPQSVICKNKNALVCILPCKNSR